MTAPRRKPGKKISDAQREELLALYFAQGREAAAQLAARYGVGPNYAGKLASARGLRPLSNPFPSNRPRIPAADALGLASCAANTGDQHASDY